ncbi:MAG: hypothetical protein ABSD13_17770 [Candidatus Korobacteraceae bacterium]|jgi:hypothetical protein
MFRIEFYEMPDRINVRVEGRFVGDFAEHARLLIAKSEAPSRFVVDLSDVSYIDEVGEQVLIWFNEIGVRFTADSLYSRDTCERLQLPMHGGRSVTFRHHLGSAGRQSHRAIAPSDSEALVAGEMRRRPSNGCSSALVATDTERERLGNSK